MWPFMRIGAVVFLSIVVLSFGGAVAILPTYATATITLTLNPPNPTYGDLVEFQGTITPKAGISQEVAVNLYRSSGCNISQYLFNIEGSTERTGSSFSIGMRLGVAYLVYVGPGTYSAFAYISNSPNISSGCMNFTVSAPVVTSTTSSMTRSSQSVTMTVTVITTVTSLTMSSTESGLSAVTKTYLQISSNSTISNLQFDSQKKLINFTASGPSGTIGSTTIVFVKSLINGVPVVLIDNGHTPPISILLTNNSTHYSLTVTYPHSTHSVTIGGSSSIPEFPVGLPVLLIFTLIACGLIARSTTRKRPVTRTH